MSQFVRQSLKFNEKHPGCLLSSTHCTQTHRYIQTPSVTHIHICILYQWWMLFISLPITHTYTNAQPPPAAISNEILKAFSVFLCHILNSAAVVAHHTTPHTHTQTLLNYHWWHRLAQMQTHITTQSYTIYSITLILFPSFTHTHTDRSCTHTCLCAHIFLLPCNQSLTQIQLPVFPWRSQSFSHATPWCCSEGGNFLPKSSSILSLHHGF